MTRVHRQDVLRIGLLALVVGGLLAGLIQHPGYTDAYYYYNVAERWAGGQGLTDVSPWSYIAAPHALPIPSHLYWTPGATFVAAGGIALFGPSFDAAQVFYVVLFVPIVLLGYAVGWQLSGTRRVAWISALLTLFSGFFWPWWVTTATFTPFGLAGAGSLFAAGMGRKYGGIRWFALAGLAAGFCHLTRNDGFLPLLVVIPAAVWPGGFGGRWSVRKAVMAAGVATFGYLLVMAPWFARNYSIAGSIQPGGGIETAFLRVYDEIVNYPPGVTLQDYLLWGWQNILNSKWEGLQTNLVRFLSEQGLIILVPFMLYTFWRRRKDPFLTPFVLYAPGLFVVMTFIFTFPGLRGAIFHSSAALMPFWAALGILGVDSAITWLAKKRRWPIRQARGFFSTALVLFAIGLSLYGGLDKAKLWNTYGERYNKLSFPKDAVIMVNDPPALYYFRDYWCVVVPNAPPEVLFDIANKYNVSYIVLDKDRTAPLEGLWERRNVPFFLKHEYYDGEFRVYSVRDKAESRETN